MAPQRLQIARGLCGDQRRERIALSRDLHILFRPVDQLEEPSRWRTTLVQLPRGVQEPRTVAERDRGAGRGADCGAQLADGGVEIARRWEITHDRDVVGRA